MLEREGVRPTLGLLSAQASITEVSPFFLGPGVFSSVFVLSEQEVFLEILQGDTGLKHALHPPYLISGPKQQEVIFPRAQGPALRLSISPGPASPEEKELLRVENNNSKEMGFVFVLFCKDV